MVVGTAEWEVEIVAVPDVMMSFHWTASAYNWTYSIYPNENTEKKVNFLAMSLNVNLTNDVTEEDLHELSNHMVKLERCSAIRKRTLLFLKWIFMQIVNVQNASWMDPCAKDECCVFVMHQMPPFYVSAISHLSYQMNYCTSHLKSSDQWREPL
ncbi:hypothetical protein EVAR_74004_1 [Eumeta japonica]|uniref:Uncharacterized protein n=1 Tax=Eumeta variegata TaxID=151549 RepID=A0A4C1TBU8_EUMVA|nr:hypothetical protein EVAR_74004_1 [Eumeta japonica]